MIKLKLEDDAIREVIEGYTRESGVSGLERKIGSLIRKALAEMLKKRQRNINSNNARS